MSARHAILEHLLSTRNAATERVIDTVLAEAPPQEQWELSQVLLKRNRRAGWVTLIRAFNRLDERVQGQMVANPRDLFGPLAETMQDSDGPSRENVIAIVRRCADVKLTFLLAEALVDRRPTVRELAGRALLETMRVYQSRAPEDQAASSAEDAQQMERAMERGLRQFKTHRQGAAVTAALALERQQDGAVWACFGDTYDELTRAGTLILRNAQEPLVARGLLLALTSTLKAAAMAGLSAAELPEMVQAILKESYRLADPVVRNGAAAVTHAKLFVAGKKHQLITAENWRQWVHLVEAMGLPGAQKVTALLDLLDKAPAGPEGMGCRVAVAAAAARTQAPEAGPLLLRVAQEGDERTARIAARYLVERRYAGQAHWDWKALAASLSSSPHASVRRIVQQAGKAPALRATGVATAVPEPRPTPFEQVWGQYAKLPPAMQHHHTRAAASDPAFVESLKTKLAATQVTELAQGLKMLASLPSQTAYRGQIIALCGHADARVAAIAVRLAGRLDDPRLKDLLELAAHHADARVRANAVDSMAQLHIADKSQQVLAMLNSRHNRERANAIKAISQFDFATARECLVRMLADPNPIHRISALFVVDQLQLLEMVRQVSGIARRDPNVRVRRRAETMLNTLTTLLPAGV
jgi:hypothetical protein